MIDYNTSNFSEIIKSISIGGRDQEVPVDRVIQVQKRNGQLEEKEMWPANPVNLILTTSYDFYENMKKLPYEVSAYSAPDIKEAVLQANPIQITVTPYPLGSKWMLRHSDNIVDNPMFHEVYSGQKTLVLPIQLDKSGLDEEDTTSQYCWVEVYSNSDKLISTTPRFHFYIKPTPPSSGGEGEEEVATDPIFKWTFDDSSKYLVDQIQGASLASYKNRFSLNNEAMESRMGVGRVGNALKAVNITSAENKSIKAGDIYYKRMSSSDQPDAEFAKCCWIDFDTESRELFTTNDYAELVVGDSLYNQQGDDSGLTVEEKFETESNYYSCHTGETLTDADNTYTISCYLKYLQGLNIGFRDYLDIGQGYYTCTPLMIKQGQQTVSALQAFDIRNFNSLDGWYHVALTKTKKFDASDPQNAYTEEKGEGFIVHSGYYVKNVGFPYDRDPESDKNGKYAFKWGWLGKSDKTCPKFDDVDIPMVWLDSETPNTGDPAYVYRNNEFEQISEIYYPNGWTTIPYKLEYIYTKEPIKFPRYSDRQTVVAEINSTQASNGRLNGGNFIEGSVFKNGSNYRIGFCYVDGELAKMGVINGNGPDPIDGDLFRIKLQYTNNTGDTKFDGVDQVCIYDRKLTQGELSKLREEFAKEASSQKPKLNVTYNVQNQLKKIKVDGSWYIQYPDYTYYDPTSEDDKQAKFGWKKFSGNSNIEMLWTPDPTTLSKNVKCIIEKGGAASEDYKIQDIASILTNEIPFECDLVPYVIDNKTIAVVVCTHDEIVRTMRRLFPNCEAIAYNSGNGYLSSYNLGYSLHCLIWRTHDYCQNEICTRADTEANWIVDGNGVTLSSRTYTAPYDFSARAIQWRNCQPGDPWYCDTAIEPPSDGRAPDIMQVAYLTLPTPMQEGTTHRVEWCGNTCEFRYDHEFACSSIKINQEGYLPWARKKRAYVGRWVGACKDSTFTPFTPDQNQRTFYIVPYSHPDIDHAVCSGEMTQRCEIGKAIDKNNPKRVASDRYGQGGRANRPMNGENLFEIDFSGIENAVKDALTMAYPTGVTSAKFFRDEVEDYVDGKITVGGNIYSRCFDKDTCNAYAWYNESATPDLIYTDTHIPTLDEKARLGYDDYDTLLDITQVTSEDIYGWTTERTCEEDYRDYATVWTHGYPSVGQQAFDEDGTEFTINNILQNQTTEDISGYYQIYVPNIGWSFKFLIHPQGYFHAYYMAQRGLFHQRSGCDQVNHPYTNWEYMRADHEIPFRGNFCPVEGQAGDTSSVWQVDPVTHDPIFSEAGGLIGLNSSGKAFSQNSTQYNYDTQQMYGIVGGWHDAADFDMREYHIPMVRQLAIAYCVCPDNFASNQLDLPESGNGIPDILNEAMWGGRLWLNSQEPDGGIHGWFETRSHESSWPWESEMKYFCCAPSMRHSMSWAASAATLARALRIAGERSDSEEAKKKMKELEKVYTDSATTAFAYATKELHDLYMKDPDNERKPSSYFEAIGKTWAWKEWISVFQTENEPTSGFKTPYGTDMFQAACALYALTKEKRYRDFINQDTVSAHIGYFNDTYAMNTTNEVAWELITVLKDEFPEYVEQIKNKYKSYSDTWIAMQEQHPYRWFTYNPGHKYIMNQQWGSAHPEGRCGAVLATWMLTKDEKYRDAVIAAFDQVYGCNNLGRSWVVGSGEVYPAKHLDSWLPRNTIRNDYWSSRPGISPYYIGHNELPDAKMRSMYIGLRFEGRSDQACPAINCHAIPQYIENIVGTSYDNYYFDRVPYQGAAQLYGSQWVHVAAFEYTVWETMSRKAQMMGMLMGTCLKPKHWYKQMAPQKGFSNPANIRNWAFLP